MIDFDVMDDGTQVTRIVMDGKVLTLIGHPEVALTTMLGGTLGEGQNA